MKQSFPPTPTVCSTEDYLLGAKLRREFIKSRNPVEIIKKQVEKEELIEWANK